MFLIKKKDKQLDEHFNFMSSNLLHCTAKFIGNKELHPATYHYFRNPHLSMSIGKTFRLKIVGLSITNRTIGTLNRSMTQWLNKLFKLNLIIFKRQLFRWIVGSRRHCGKMTWTSNK